MNCLTGNYFDVVQVSMKCGASLGQMLFSAYLGGTATHSQHPGAPPAGGAIVREHLGRH